MLLCGRRDTRMILAVLGVIIVVYIPFTIISTIAISGHVTSGNPSSLSTFFTSQKDSPFEIRDIIPKPDGNLDLVLSVNIKRLLSAVNGEGLNNGEATNNPLPMNVSVSLYSKSVCADPQLKWVLYVHTAPGNKQRRQIVRNTWGNRKLFKDKRTEIIFMMGQPKDPGEQRMVLSESKIYGDIIQGDFIEDYKNLTLKGLMSLKFISTHCAHVKYVVKADDDAFINLFKLMEIQEMHEGKKRVLTCPLWHENGMPILRDPASCMKWCVKYNEFPGLRYFPKYCAGLTYVLSGDLVPELYRVSQSTPFFWIDDVYLTGLLPPKVGQIEYVNLLENFTLKEDLAYAGYMDRKQPLKYVFAHVKKEDHFYQMWQSVMERLTARQRADLNVEAVAMAAKLAKKGVKV